MINPLHGKRTHAVWWERGASGWVVHAYYDYVRQRVRDPNAYQVAAGVESKVADRQMADFCGGSSTRGQQYSIILKAGFRPNKRK
jgi:hypothetical protein